MPGPVEIHGHYSVPLVALSVAIAMIAAYASLDLARRASQTSGVKRMLWLGAAGVIMGFGIWSMHFVGMLSFEMPMEVDYQGALVALSLVVAVAGASIALAVVTRPHVTRSGLLTGSAFLGVGLAAMHYIGMDSMRMDASIHWNALLVALSIAIGLGASYFALWLVVRITADGEGLRFGYHLAAAVLLGLGIAGLHYVGMAASTYYGTTSADTHSGFSTDALVVTLGIAGGVAFVALLGVLVAEQRRADLAVDLALVAGLSRDLAHGSDVRGGICQTAQRLTGADRVTLLELNKRLELHVTATCGTDEAEADQPGGKHELELLKAGQRVFMTEGEAPGEGAVLYEPLILDDVPVALLRLRWTQSLRRLPERTATLLGMLGADAAVLIDRQDLMTKLEFLAQRDELTGLANRRVLREALDQAIEGAARALMPVSVIMIDLDNFKIYNDTLGHQAGDRLLMSAAAAWSGLVRATDTIARIGGDEFAVVLPECPQERAIHTANQLREAVPPDGGGCSAGVATWDFTETPGHLLHRADQALYVAKGGGGHRTGVADWSPTKPAPTPTPPAATPPSTTP